MPPSRIRQRSAASRCWSCWYAGERPLEALGVITIRLLERRIAPQEGVLGHVGRVAAGGWRVPHGLGNASNVVRPGPAAHPEVVDPERLRGPSKVEKLVTGTGERVQGGGEGPDIGRRIAQRLHGRLLRRR